MRLREVRERLAVTQVELHDRSGVSRTTISALEGGKHRANASTLRKLAKALGVPVTELTAGPEEGALVTPDAPKGAAPPLPDRDPEVRRANVYKSLRLTIDGVDRLLWESMDEIRLDLVIFADGFEQHLWRYVVPKIGVERIEGMSREEREAHEQVIATITGLGATIDEAYDAATKNFFYADAGDEEPGKLEEARQRRDAEKAGRELWTEQARIA